MEVKYIIYYMYMLWSTQMVNAHKNVRTFFFSMSWKITENQKHISFSQSVLS